MAEPTDAELAQEWDAIVIGTGMGGAPLGHALARAGMRVLFLERGSDAASDPALHGYPELHFDQTAAPGAAHQDMLMRAGRYPDLVDEKSGIRGSRFVPFVGAGLGGSSSLYGMALERFFPADFEPRRHHAHNAETTLPDAWPISYAELAPYYAEAERLFRIRGTPDPLRGVQEDERAMPAPPPLTPGAAAIVRVLESRNLHPYRLPLACEFVDDCATCQGYLCDRRCKNDARRICLEPAFELGAQVLVECEVVRLEASRTSVGGVVCVHRGVTRTLRAKRVILAAGALETPRLLLRSASAAWPNGLANDSDMVGRNLMRHQIDLYLVDPKLGRRFDNRHKEFAFNDFYQVDGQKLGSVQSFGRLPPAPLLAASMADDLRQGPLPWLAPWFKLIRPIIQPLLARMVEARMIMASTLEDLPYADNRVTLPEDEAAAAGVRLVIHYRLRGQDRRRIDAFRGLMKGVLASCSYSVVKQAENNQRIAHACGTCRFGSDPATSVLDRNNRAHGLANLYVVDGSFFPSSGGTNPSLTIAANALRVASHLIESA